MIEIMATVHITEAELARDLHALLEKVQSGVEVVIEKNHQPIAVIKPSKPGGRLISDVIADLKARGSDAVMDDDFANDIAAGIEAHRQPWKPPSWE
jgi:antitoxin (DNA-binding transcriptional repressor) of toxin-antitoxin stability system